VYLSDVLDAVLIDSETESEKQKWLAMNDKTLLPIEGYSRIDRPTRIGVTNDRAALAKVCQTIMRVAYFMKAKSSLF